MLDTVSRSIRKETWRASLIRTLIANFWSAPIRLAISTDNPRQWPAWNMDFEDEQRAPRNFVSGDLLRSESSKLVQCESLLKSSAKRKGRSLFRRIRLSTGDAGNRVEFSNVIDWKTKEANLKATFPLAAANNLATYNWDVGTIQRPNEEERQFEVASHQWIDLTDKNGAYGVTVLTDCKNASDKPDDKTLRLTLIRTPGTRGGYPDQGTQDIGRHEIMFGLAGHANDWRAARTDWQAYRLNQPLIAFQSPAHSGALGRTLSLLTLSDDRIRVMAFKKAELSDELIVRMVELDGTPATNVRVRFPSSVVAAREVNGQEQPLGPATIVGTELETSFKPYQPRTFAIKLAPSRTKIAPAHPSLFRLITIWRSHRGWAGRRTAALIGRQTIRARRKARLYLRKCCRGKSTLAAFVSILLRRKSQTRS